MNNVDVVDSIPPKFIEKGSGVVVYKKGKDVYRVITTERNLNDALNYLVPLFYSYAETLHVTPDDLFEIVREKIYVHEKTKDVHLMR